MIYISIIIWGILSIVIIAPYLRYAILWVSGSKKHADPPPDDDKVSIWCDAVIGKPLMKLTEISLVAIFVLLLLSNFVFSHGRVTLVLSACIVVISISVGGAVSFKIAKHLISCLRSKQGWIT